MLEKCPECRKKKLKRLFGTGAAIVFKGSGFYQTDYRSESYKKAAKAAKAEKGGSEGSAGEKKEKKSSSDAGTKASTPPSTSGSND